MDKWVNQMTQSHREMTVEMVCLRLCWFCFARLL